MIDKLTLQKQFFPAAEGKKDLNYWRELTLLWITLPSVVLGFFSYISSVWVSARSGHWEIVALNSIVYLWLIGIFLLPQLPFRWRAFSIGIMFYILGTLLLVSLGLQSSALCSLFAFPILIGILLDFRVAVIALIMNAATMVLITVLVWMPSVAVESWSGIDLVDWIVVALNFLVLNTIITLPISRLITIMIGLIDDPEPS